MAAITSLHPTCFHCGAYVMAFVEATSECGPRHLPECDDDCPDCPENFEPRTILEISDCSERIELWFDIDRSAGAPTRYTSSTR